MLTIVYHNSAMGLYVFEDFDRSFTCALSVPDDDGNTHELFADLPKGKGRVTNDESGWYVGMRGGDELLTAHLHSWHGTDGSLEELACEAMMLMYANEARRYS